MVDVGLKLARGGSYDSATHPAPRVPGAPTAKKGW